MYSEQKYDTLLEAELAGFDRSIHMGLLYLTESVGFFKKKYQLQAIDGCFIVARCDGSFGNQIRFILDIRKYNPLLIGQKYVVDGIQKEDNFVLVTDELGIDGIWRFKTVNSIRGIKGGEVFLQSIDDIIDMASKDLKFNKTILENSKPKKVESGIHCCKIYYNRNWF